MALAANNLPGHLLFVHSLTDSKQRLVHVRMLGASDISVDAGLSAVFRDSDLSSRFHQNKVNSIGTRDIAVE